jgi:hypothetical protein
LPGGEIDITLCIDRDSCPTLLGEELWVGGRSILPEVTE